MHLVVLSNDNLKNELLAQGQNSALQITWVTDPQQLTAYPDADIYLDLLFESTPERIILLQRLGKPLMINSVAQTLALTDPAFIRINGWLGFLQSATVEASGTNDVSKNIANSVFQLLGKQVTWLPDEVGFVTPRVISAIINEAYLALEEGVSTKEEINTAMKLGTNYPYGPFEWAAVIGLPNVLMLLKALSNAQDRYQPCALLLREAAV